MKKTYWLLIAAICFASLPCALHAQSTIVTTIAGNGTSGYSGDGGQATAASISGPADIMLDNSGNAYVASYYNSNIRKISPSGIITTIAGLDTAGYDGEGTVATASHLHSPVALLLDDTGNLYVAQLYNDRVMKISPSGIMTTFAGTGVQGYSGDGGQATAAKLNRPGGLAADASGNIYIADYANNAVRKVTPAGIISTFAGYVGGAYAGDGGAATSVELHNPWGLRSDTWGNLYIAEAGANKVRMVDTGGIMHTIAGTGDPGFSSDGGAATAAELHNCTDIAFDGAGNMYIADQLNYRIRKIDTGGIISTVAGIGIDTFTADCSAATATGISDANSLFVSESGVVYFTDNSNNRVRRLSGATTISGSASVCVGSTTTLSATTSGGTWSSDDTATATVSGAGIVSGISPGTANIRYILSTVCESDTTLLTVTVNPLPTLDLGDASEHFLCVGTSGHVPITDSGAMWTISDTTKAIYDPTDSMLYGLSPGAITVTYTLLTGCYITTTGTVVPAPNAGVISGPGAVCVGSTISLSTTGLYGSWYSADTTKATVDSSGIVSGVAAGVTAIYYLVNFLDCGSDTASYLVTINPNPGGDIGISADHHLCIGETVNIGIDDSGATWSVSDTTLLSYNPTDTSITGLAAGALTLTYTLPSGCYATTTGTVDAAADAGTVSGPTSVSAGFSIVLSSSSMGGAWSSEDGGIAIVGSSGTVTGVSTGSTTITYIVSNSCGSDTATFLITVTGSSDTTISGTLFACAGMSSTLSSSVSGGTWSSGSPAVATIDASTGSVTGVSSGTTLISYIIGSTTRMVVFTVNPVPLPITGDITVCAGSTTSLSSATSGGSWTASPGSVATVSESGVVTGVAAGSATVSYTLPSGCYNTRTITVNPLPTAIGGTLSLCEGTTTTLTNSTPGGSSWSSGNLSIATVGSSSGVVTGVAPGTADITYTLTTSCAVKAIVTVHPAVSSIAGHSTYCTGATETLSVDASCGSWSSSNSATASVDTSGVLSAIASGTAIISFTSCEGCVSTKAITVNPAPGAITGTTGICEGSTALLSSGTAGGTWSSSNGSTASINSSGLVSALTPGTTIISYVLASGCDATTVVTVTAALSSTTGEAVVCAGQNVSLANTTSGGTWSSSTPLKATVNAYSGLVTGIAAGSATITYSIGAGCYTTTVVTVNGAMGAITGTRRTCAGNTTTLYNTTGGGSWISSNGSVASAGSSTGVISGVAAGTAVISYIVSSGCVKTAIVTIDPIPSDISGTLSVCEGRTSVLSNSGGISWASSTPAVATIAGSGVVTGISAGTTTITYTTGTGCYTTATVTVTTAPSAITGASSICSGSTGTLSSTAGGTWESGNTAVATVGSTDGVASGIAAGTAVISYTQGGCTVTRGLTVQPSPSTIHGNTSLCEGGASIVTAYPSGGTWSASGSAATISPSTGSISATTTGTTIISYTISNGCSSNTVVSVGAAPAAISGTTAVCIGQTSTLTNTSTGGTWISSASPIATVGSSSGVVTGISTGTATVSYSISAGCWVTTVVTVSTSPGAIGGSSSVCVAASITLTHTSAGGTWSSSSSSIASVNATTGEVTGISAGSVLITYSLGSGCYVTKALTVYSGISTPITGTTTLCEGSYTVLSCITGTSWASSNPAIATIGSASGLVTGVSAGTSEITFTGTTGCIATTVVTVLAKPDPISGSLTICRTATTVLSSSPTGGLWSSSAPSKASVGSTTGLVTGVNAGYATISYTLPTGCRSTVTITVAPLPSLPAIVGPGYLHTSSPVTLTASGSAVGTWTSENPARATVVAGPANTTTAQGVTTGTVWITFSVSSSCGSTFRRRLFTVVAPRPGTEFNETVSLIRLYPNPTTGTFTLETGVSGKLEINGIDGRHLASYPVAEPATLVTLPPNLASGVYMCRFEGEDGSSMIVKLVLDAR